ncbi:uncharacterized protein si:dkey-92i15.4 [Periophthalmus magnuspinnatus]|uniref:uncharacterized protein si:dkey-92i15.4 n=1 Tax=Periophthalmus magnuspinnatus TaxID=409849 RepID=UPI00145B7701|nr:uncharacterized protein si:dkey-92i15.4 [Periophthalmus magnuspinnatus]XP_055083867.1 uncharacterized protein si:dkey-92i15.4 [Periophthalmus magnuspinnatus]XP_055083868.1 uncharacterized protein si:dkey-92i15.4 [Periophthalmus magnuspinnatus]XP_055083869.1 uncharacterized protein si:dkey-92i15.4 [Periophthalmus magnuspinnatus]XP_055083870.1 uncharacterized protein si:dkey-92i15.4 [Periophthalmus magnuspinnatus]XP_055083871.1 uncharacterized protein si:dkey-92i15.4 [Periophthalmus magnuspin
MDFLSTTGREYNTQTGAHFTIRSANSLSYNEAWRTSRYKQEEKESRDRPGTKTESSLHYQPRICSGVKGQSLESDKTPIKQNQSSLQDDSSKYDQTGKSERRGRTEWRRNYLSSRSKSLDWGTRTKSPERSWNYREDILGRTGDRRAEGSRVMSTVYAYNTVNKTNDQDFSLSKAKGQSLPSRYTSASLGPKGGQSILERIEKLYGSMVCGNTEDYKTTESVTPYKGSFSGTFPRRFSSGEQRRSSGQNGNSLSWTTCKDTSVSTVPNRITTSGWWQNQDNTTSYAEGGTFQSRVFIDIGTRSLDRARSRSTQAAKIRAARAAEEMDKPVQSNTFLRGISEVNATPGREETNKMEDMNHKNWSRMTLKEINPGKKEIQAEDINTCGQMWVKKENSTDDMFNSQKYKITSVENNNNKPLVSSAASVRNKINQFEALTLRNQTSSPRRAFSVPEYLSKTYNGVQRSSSAKAIGSLKWGELREEQPEKREVTDIKTFVSRGGKEPDQEKPMKKETDIKGIRYEVSKFKRVPDKEFQNARDPKGFNEYSKTILDLSNTKVSPPIMDFNFDETDFGKVVNPLKLRDINTSSGSDISTPTSSDSDETPTNTPGTSPHLSPTAPPQKTPPLTLNKSSLDSSTPLTSNLPDLVSKDDLNGKKRILDLNAWLDGLNPQIKAWEDNKEEDDDSTQKDEDSNYDSDSGESSVTVTSAMSNKSFSVSLADLCNFAGVDYESENDTDEWQPAGRRSASLSSDISAFSHVSVLPTEELDKLIEDVKSIGDDNLQDYEDVHVVVLHKEIGVGLGFSLAGGVDQNKPVTVHKVFHSGVAAQEGSIKEGDQVLSINGSALSGFAHWEALRVLRRAKSREMGVVVLKKPDMRALSDESTLAMTQGPTPAQVNETSQYITVSLEKTDRDLGFSLEGGVDSSLGNKPLTVQKVFQGGPVEKVLPGDEVLEVNGVSVVGLRRLEAWTLIRKLSPGPVSVVLRRRPQLQNP